MKYAYLLKLKPKRLKICMSVNSDNSTILKLVSNTLSIIQILRVLFRVCMGTSLKIIGLSNGIPRLYSATAIKELYKAIQY